MNNTLTPTNEIIFKLDLEKQRALIQSHYRQSIKELAEIGRILKETHRALHGNTWEAFLKTLPFSRHSAYNFMRIHEHVLKHGDAILAIEQIKISAWYILPPENNEAVQMILDKAARGETVTKIEAKTVLSSVKFQSERHEQAWHTANDISTPFLMNAVATGVITDNVTGEDIPLEDAEPTLVVMAAEKDKYERIQRHSGIVQPLHGAKSITVKLQQIEDKQGRLWLALPQDIPAVLIKSPVTFWYEEMIESEAAA